jgi:hypothetical protein
MQRARGVTVFSDNLLVDVAIEREIRHDLFQFGVSWRRNRSSRSSCRLSPLNRFLHRQNVCSLADPEPATDLGDFSPPSTWCNAWIISSFVRPFRGIGVAPLAGVRQPLKKPQILRFSPFPCTELWGLGQAKAPRVPNCSEFSATSAPSLFTSTGFSVVTSTGASSFEVLHVPASDHDSVGHSSDRARRRRAAPSSGRQLSIRATRGQRQGERPGCSLGFATIRQFAEPLIGSGHE